MSGMVEAITALANRDQVPQVNFEAGALQSNVQTDSFAEAVQEFKELMAAPRARTLEIIRDENGRMVRVEESS